MKVYEAFKNKDVNAAELFNAIDVNSDFIVDLNEVSRFMMTLLNDNMENKSVFEKEVRIIMNFMDIDNNGQVSKAEFIRQFDKMAALYNKL